jgi:hypothetical protein
MLPAMEASHALPAVTTRSYGLGDLEAGLDLGGFECPGGLGALECLEGLGDLGGLECPEGLGRVGLRRRTSTTSRSVPTFRSRRTPPPDNQRAIPPPVMSVPSCRTRRCPPAASRAPARSWLAPTRLRWWSTLEASWIQVTLFDRALGGLSVHGVRTLAVDDEAVAAAASYLGLA